MADVTIAYKGTAVAELNDAGTKTLKTAGKYCEADILVSYSRRTPPDASKPVKLFDYDGTLVYSYTAAEFLALTALPNNPAHDGLIAQGWNWTLANAKAYVADTGRLVIGQNYITSDGKTRLYIHVDRATSDLGIYLKGSLDSLDIDWGDGSAHDTVSSSSLYTLVTHQYPDEEHDYVVSITPEEDTNWVLGPTCIRGREETNTNSVSPFRGVLNKVEFGVGVSNIVEAFKYCTTLMSVSIPTSATDWGARCVSYSNLGFLVVPNNSYLHQWAFNYAGLKYIALPKNVTWDGRDTFENSTKLLEICLVGKAEKSYTVSNVLGGCTSLCYASLSDGGVRIKERTFRNCAALKEIVIPASVTYIEYGNGSPFEGTKLSVVQFRSTTPPTLAGSGTFYYLPSYAVILCPYESIIAYKGATNYPSASSTKYIGFYKGTAGETLPATITDDGVTHDLVWYASVSDARNENAPITTMQGDEVYCLSTPQPEEDPT